jgi:hypothetical protein
MVDLSYLGDVSDFYKLGYNMCSDGKPTMSPSWMKGRVKGARIRAKVKRECVCGKTFTVPHEGRQPKICQACRTARAWRNRK